MDLTSIQALDVAPVVIRHPKTKRATDIVIYLASKDSQTFRDAIRSRQLRAMKSEEDEITPETIERETIAFLAACVTGWDGVKEGGKDLECTPETVQRVFKEYPWIMRQVDQAWGDESRFFAESSVK